MTAQTAEAAVAAPVVAAPVETTPQAPAKVEGKAPEAPVDGKAPEAPAEAKPEAPAPEAPPKADKVAAAFAGLAKKEKALVEQQRRFSAERAALAAEKVEAQKYIQSLRAEAVKADEFHKLKESARRNPMKVLESLGLSYDDLSSFVMNESKLTPEQETRAAIEEAKAEARRAAEQLEAYKREQQEGMTRAQKAAAERAAKEEETLRDQFYGGAVAFVKQNVADYELILQNGAEAEVPRLIEETYKQSGKVLSVAEAAGQVEGYLLEQLEKVTSSQKWQRLQAAKSRPVEPTPTTSAPVTTQKPPPTITNAMAPATKPTKTAPETEEERVARAVAAFHKNRGK